MKDLGVTFDQSLSFDVHIQTTLNKASRMIGIIRRTFTYFNKTSLLLLYKALVRPILEYANEIWYPHLIRQSKAIEIIQRRATKLLHQLKWCSYEVRMHYLGLPSLKYRRRRGDMITVYKILNGLSKLDWRDFFYKGNR